MGSTFWHGRPPVGPRKRTSRPSEYVLLPASRLSCGRRNVNEPRAGVLSAGAATQMGILRLSLLRLRLLILQLMLVLSVRGSIITGYCSHKLFHPTDGSPEET